MSNDIIPIALVDDHVLFRKGLALIFADTPDIEVIIEASDGHELLGLMKARQPEVILLDLEMPGMDGTQTLEVLRKDFPEIKVILLTMFGNEEFMLKFLRSGASGYLLKDAHPDELEDAIRKVNRTGFYLSERVSKVMLSRLQNDQPMAPTPDQEDGLVERELEVLELICQEKTTAEIADTLFLSVRTIESYRKRLLEKTGARNTAGLVLYAVRNGLFEEK